MPKSPEFPRTQRIGILVFKNFEPLVDGDETTRGQRSRVCQTPGAPRRSIASLQERGIGALQYPAR